MSVRAVRPLNMDASRAADAAVAAETGGRPLTMGPEDAELREKWMEAYIAAGGKVEKVQPRHRNPNDCREGCPCKPISAITLVSLTFTSDHDLLKNYTTDWKNGGSRFPKPEWTLVQQLPISHSMDLPVSVHLELNVEPPDACVEMGNLRGEAPGGLVFEKKGVSFKPGKLLISLTSDQKLDKKIQKLGFQVNWSSEGTSAALSAKTSNPVYVTIGTPRDPAQAPHDVTLKRMEKAVELVAPMGTTNPQTIVHGLMKKLPYYVLHAHKDVPSKYNHPKYFNSEGGAWPIADYMAYYAECQAIVRFVRKIIKQLGVPGDGKMVYVYADPAAPMVAKEDDESKSHPALHNHLGYALLDQKVTSADVGRRYPPSHTKMPDGSTSMGFNAYEACLKFTAQDGPEGKSGPLKTYYYPGGTGGSQTEDLDHVLKHSFFALVEFVSAWYPTDSDPNKVEGYKITKIVADYSPFH